MLNVSTYSYLIAINGRRHVANVFGKPIYLITDVAFIPLSSQQDAASAIIAAKQNAKHERSDTADASAVEDLLDDADNDTVKSLSEAWLNDRVASGIHSGAQSKALQSTAGHEMTGSAAQDVIGRQGVYGRFADRWFSKRGWVSGQQRNMGMSSHENLSSMMQGAASRRRSSAAHLQTTKVGLATLTPAIGDGDGSPVAPPKMRPADDAKQLPLSNKAHDVSNTIGALLPKLIQTLKLLLISNMFYFSYDYDITRQCSRQPTGGSDLPLSKRCKSQYFWNAHLADPLVEGGYDEYVLPIMQGFVGQRVFGLDTSHRQGKPESLATIASTQDAVPAAKSIEMSVGKGRPYCLLTLISRRSNRRAGFRYMRRGIDEKGNVANYVESEQILSSSSWDMDRIHSFVQVRGSIPLFYSQTPYTFKPVPILRGSADANQRAIKTHFSSLAVEYGQLQAVSLIDRYGGELSIGNGYEDHISLLNSSGGVNGHSVNFEWFDFHKICRGMNFENVSLLLDTLRPFLDSNGWTTFDLKTRKQVTSQGGIIRTNCMDCLDRTNVVQSAIARHILSQQFIAFLPGHAQSKDPSSEAFNSLWADNGDAISLTYAGTAALKGDYVRNRRRNIAGVLTDLSLAISRYYRNLFDDFFAQTALDFMLGNVSEVAFVEFRERMTTTDVGVDIAKAREMAVASAGRVIVGEDEDLLGGWVLSAPSASANPTSSDEVASIERWKMTPAELRAQPFREVVLLLSDVAIYCVTYDWDVEKVRGFERIQLASLKRLQSGSYITQTLTERQQDPASNLGLLVEFQADGKQRLHRVNTRILDVGSPEETQSQSSIRIWAFKALSSNSPTYPTSEDLNATATSPEHSTISHVVSEVQQAFTRNAMRRKDQPAPAVPGKSAKAEADAQADVIDATSDSQYATELPFDEKPIVSLSEAQKSTSMMEKVEYGLKRLVWG